MDKQTAKTTAAVTAAPEATPAGHHNPTTEQFGAYQGAFDYFNRTLFEGRLPPTILNFSRAGARTLGFFAPERWQRTDQSERTHEISLSPLHLRTRSLEEIFSTLVHEMCHLEQHEFGKPSRNGYHNAEWGRMMDKVGLTPSNTGAPGGARTGQRMTHFVAPGGAFQKAFEAMPPELKLPWRCSPELKAPVKGKNKVKYGCGCPKKNIWAKPELEGVECSECHKPFIPAVA